MDSIELQPGRVPGSSVSRDKRGDQTKQLLLDTASTLFAAQGMRGVALRDIVKAAGTNIASVSYHFGSKEQLFIQVFLRASNSFAQELMAALRACPEQPRHDRLERLIEAFLKTGLDRAANANGSGSSFMRLRTWLVAEDPALAARLLSQTQDVVGEAYIDELMKELPGLTRTDVVWRFHALLGTTIFTVAHGGRVAALTHGKAHLENTAETVATLVPILAAAFRHQPASHTSGTDTTDAALR